MSREVIIEAMDGLAADDFNDDIVSDDIIIDEAGDNATDSVIDEAADDDGSALPKGAVRNTDGTVTLKLIKPVELQIRDQSGRVRVECYESLTFHYLTGVDLRAIRSAKENEQNIVAFARATKLSMAVMNKLFDKMHAADINAAGEVMAAFLARGH